MSKDTRSRFNILEARQREGLTNTRIGPPQEVVGDAAPLFIEFIQDQVALSENENKDPPSQRI